MPSPKPLYFAISLLLGFPNHALGLFNSKSLVKDMSGPEFEKKIHKIKHVTMVKFYAPWCGHCKNLAPIYHEVAAKIKDVAKVVAINCDEEMNKPVCSKYDVKGFPTLKLFPSSIVSKGKTKKPLDYNGERSKKAIKDFIINAIPDTSKKVVASGKETKYSISIDKFLENESSEASPKVLLFSEKPAAQPIYKSLALEFHERASFGLILKKEAELVKRFEVEKFPSLLVIPSVQDNQNESSSPVKYEGEFSFEKLKNFLESYATPKKTKATQPKNEAETKPEEKEEPFDPEVAKLAEQEEFEKECLNKAGICILNLIPSGQESVVESLKAIKKKIHDTKNTFKMITTVPDINFYYTSVLPTTFLTKQFEMGDVTTPVTLILQPRRKLYAFKELANDDTLQDSLYEFLESGVKGKIKFYQYSFIPKIKKIKKARVTQDSDYDEL
ncbi:hypothetical protein DSO57_1007590 [Entomophthora muscae]|nr:hypothetical protein DSO57_1007590 [Entomophthora muscae]